MSKERNIDENMSMGEVYSVEIKYLDDGSVLNVLMSEYDEVPEGYTDEQIHFHGISKETIMRCIESGEPIAGEDFIITEFHETVKSRNYENTANNQATSYYEIWQVKDGDEYRHMRFEPYDQLNEEGYTISAENYKLAYSAPLAERVAYHFKDDVTPLLEIIYAWGNGEYMEGGEKVTKSGYPPGYAARSVSVSDVIVIKNNGEWSAHYVDIVGFVQTITFVPPNYVFVPRHEVSNSVSPYAVLDAVAAELSKRKFELPRDSDLAATVLTYTSSGNKGNIEDIADWIEDDLAEDGWEKYSVEITETLKKTVSVYAFDRGAAVDKVEAQWNKSKHVLDSSDFVDVKFDVLEKIPVNREVTVASTTPKQQTHESKPKQSLNDQLSSAKAKTEEQSPRPQPSRIDNERG